MLPARKRRSRSTSARLMEMALLAPAVAGTRLARMGREGLTPSAHGRAEMVAMVLEKQVAFSLAWTAMATELWRMQLRLASSWMAGVPSAGQTTRMLEQGLRRATAQALAPIHRRVLVNARGRR